MQSETLEATATPTADTWNALGTFSVPAGVQRLVRVKFGVTPDPAAAVIARFLFAFRIIGSGLQEQSPHEYIVTGGGVTAIAANEASLQLPLQSFDVDIPVTTGGRFDVQYNAIDEGAVPVDVKVEVAYDNSPTVRKNSMSQYADAAQPTAADAWQTVGTIIVPQLKEGNSPTRISEIVMSHAVDMAAAGTLRASARFRLSRSGIAEGGSHEFIGSAQGSSVTAAATQAFASGLVRQKTDIPVNPGGEILVEALIDTELPTAGSVAVGLLYE
jgi:hypothetical protein